MLLLVEIGDSTLRYDLNVEARLYATHGIPEYWVAHLVNRRVVRHRTPSGQQYAEREEVAAGTLALPELGVAIQIDDLF